MDEILDFLDKAEAAGQNVMSVIGSQVQYSAAQYVYNDMLVHLIVPHPSVRPFIPSSSLHAIVFEVDVSYTL